MLHRQREQIIQIMNVNEMKCDHKVIKCIKATLKRLFLNEQFEIQPINLTFNI